MKVLFTGGRGFIGRELIPLLKKDGFEVTAPSSRELNLIDNASVKDYFDKNGFEYDVIIHAAILGGRRVAKDDLLCYFDNMRMFENMISYKVDRFIHFDSGASLYGSGKISNTPYGFSKYCMSRSTEEHPGGTNLKIYGCFGPLEDENRFLKTAIKNYKNKEPITIFQDKLFDLFYVKDLYKVLKYSLEVSSAIQPKNLNCVYDRKFFLSDIAEMVNGLDSHDVPILIKEKEKGEPYCGNFSIDLDYIGLEQGIVDLYDESFC